MKKLFVVMMSLIFIVMAGCSGGGGGSSDGHNTEPATFSITGQIIYNNTGLAGISVSLSGASSAQTTTDSNGQYSFAGLANGNYTITPSLSGYVFSPSGKVITINEKDEAGVDFTATASSTPTYTISGTVSGAVQSGVTITLTGAGSGSTLTDVSGNYSFGGLANGSYTLTASKTGYSFSPVRNMAVNGANVTGQNFTATANVAPTYSISGKVSGAVLSGVTVTLTGTGSNSTTTDSSGNYSFSSAANGNYTITPSKTGYTFTPTSISVTVNDANLTGKNFTATANTTPTYTISGTVSGAVVSGVTITLTGAGSGSTLTDVSGNYSFGGLANGSYTVTPSKTGYTFNPSSLGITVNNTNITGQNFTATASTTPTYTISGTVSGAVLAGVTITLTGTGSSSTITNSGGNYSFSGAGNGSYTITPSKTGYTFTPTSISVTVNNVNLTGKNFTATANTYSISGTVTSDSACSTTVTVTLTGAVSSSTTTDSSGNYSFSGAANGYYTIKPSKNGYAYSPASRSVAVNNADLTGQNFTLTSGSLDSTFGTCGKVTTDFGRIDDGVKALGIQSDGKIVSAGTSGNGSNYYFALARYNTNGSLDTGFGTGGKVTTDMGSGYNVAHALGVQSDGKIVAAGYSGKHFALARYNTNGSLDTTFGTGGMVTTPISGVADSAQALVIQPDGKIVAVGGTNNGDNTGYFVLIRYNTNGSLDTTFGTGGIVTTPITGSSYSTANAAGIQSDGKIVAAGRCDGNFGLARYNTNGSLDTTFGENGMVTTSISLSIDDAYALAIQTDGKIVIAGSSGVGFTLARYNTNGSLDTGFGTGGIVTTDVKSLAYAKALGIQSDGKIVAAGYSYYGSNLYYSMVRYNTNGSLDTGFGTGGIVATDMGVTADAGGTLDYAKALVIQSNGKIVIAGEFSSDFVLLRYLP